MNKLILVSISIIFSAAGTNGFSIADAADQNGYTALYECRAGVPHCNVDIATYIAHACDTTITTADSGATVTTKLTNNQYVCIDKGSYLALGTISLPNSGSVGAYKVLRYTRSGDDDDEPWNQSDANLVKLNALSINNQNYWIIHRVAFPTTRTSTAAAIDTGESATTRNIIVNRVLAENISGGGDSWIVRLAGQGANTARELTLQNSVIRGCTVTVGSSHRAVYDYNATNVRIVNNEIYDCSKGVGNNFNTTNYGTVYENNDIYNTLFTDCAGNYVSESSGNCSIVKGLAGISSGGANSSNPLRFIRNRVWGAKWCDTNVSCSGGGASGMAIGGGANSDSIYILYQGNICTDSGGCFETTNLDAPNVSNHISIVGNLGYRLLDYNTSQNGGITFCCSGATKERHEIYLNTFINVKGTGWLQGGGITTSDIRGNVVISSIGSATDIGGSGTVINSNVYYASTADAGVATISNAISTRANTTGYANGIIMRLNVDPDSCTSSTDTDCFLYKQASGSSCTSAGSLPTFRAKLNSITVDNNCRWLAIRGPYTFKRKLRTVAAGESYTIPYAAKLNKSALPEYQILSSTFGSPTNIGINNNPAIGAGEGL